MSLVSSPVASPVTVEPALAVCHRWVSGSLLSFFRACPRGTRPQALAVCSSLTTKPPKQSAAPGTRGASCRPWWNCASASWASRTMRTLGRACGPSWAGRSGQAPDRGIPKTHPARRLESRSFPPPQNPVPAHTTISILHLDRVQFENCSFSRVKVDGDDRHPHKGASYRFSNWA